MTYTSSDGWETDTDPSDWTAYRLASVAEVTGPDNNESPGALFLLGVRDAVVSFYAEATEERRGTVEAGDDDWWYEETHHLADSAVPVGTHSRWLIFTDLCLWQDEAVLDIPVLTRGGGGTWGVEVDMTAQVTSVLYEVAHRLTWVILTELSNDDEVTA